MQANLICLSPNKLFARVQSWVMKAAEITMNIPNPSVGSDSLVAPIFIVSPLEVGIKIFACYFHIQLHFPLVVIQILAMKSIINMVDKILLN